MGTFDLNWEPENPLLHDLDTADVYLPAPYDTSAASSISPWPAQLPLALAMGLEDIPSILTRFDITEERFAFISPLPAFRKALSDARKEVREQGLTFKHKCRVIAEDYLDTIYTELQNAQVGLSTKVDVWKHLIRMGGLEPQATPAPTAAVNPIQININL